MSNLKRRRFLQSMLAASAGALMYARPARPGFSQPRIVMVGNGVAGQAFIQAMRRCNPAARLSCIGPQVVTTGGDQVEYLAGTVTSMDFDRKVVQTENGETAGYDALVLAPGADIRWGQVEGYTPLAAERMPHGWIGADRGAGLRTRLVDLPQGATVIIYVPDGVIRYPQAVKQRVSLVSRYLLENKKRSKLLVLDARKNREREQYSVDTVEWVDLGLDNDSVRVDADTGALHTAAATYRAHLVNFIPPQQAGALARRHGLADPSGWCPVEPSSGSSLKAPGVYLLGDASTADADVKSGMSAAKQAIRCASHLARIAG